MAFTARDMDEFLRLLRERPEFREAARRELLTEDLLELPATTRRLTEAQAGTERHLAALAERVAELAAAQARTDEQLAQLTAQLRQLTAQVNDLATQMAQLAARVDQLTARVDDLTVRLEQLTARVDNLASQLSQLAARVDQLAARVDDLTREVARVVSVQENMVREVKRLGDVSAQLHGYYLEQQYASKASSVFGKVLRRIHLFRPSELDNEVTDLLPRDDAEDWLETDLVLSGVPRYRPEVGEVWLAVEVSSVLDRSDLERAVRRAEYLRRTGRKALPAVAGHSLAAGAEQVARDRNVAVFQDGKALGWEEALAFWTQPPGPEAARAS
jgi:cell division protein FtsB